MFELLSSFTPAASQRLRGYELTFKQADSDTVKLLMAIIRSLAQKLQIFQIPLPLACPSLVRVQL